MLIDTVLRGMLLLLLTGPWAPAAGGADPSVTDERRVVLLHGLARSADSMEPLEQRLADHGYRTCNVAYPSRQHRIEVLAAEFVVPEILECFGRDAGAIDFVTHSLGGIIVRQMAASDAPVSIGRVVMLAPPNGGSEVVDELGDWWLFGLINGPAGRQLGTSSDSVPNSLGPAPFEVGIIAGNRTINFLLSSIIEGDDDGKVSIDNATLEGMDDFIVLPVTHPFIMNDEAVARQTLHFLDHGAFMQPAGRGVMGAGNRSGRHAAKAVGR